MRLIGTIDAKVDMKGRVFLPAVFRRALQQADAPRLIMRKDIFEDCLVLYTEEEWYKRLDTLRAKLSIWNQEQQMLFRRFVTDVEWIVLDNGGRFLIPKRYLQMAGINLDVTFVGMDSTIEIWAKGKNDFDNNGSLGTSLQGIMAEE